MTDRVLSEPETEHDPSKRAERYDFRRPDRIAKDQLRAIHLLHENFARSLGSSLSAYLRTYVAVNLISVEQLSFLEFTHILPSPTTLTGLGIKPFDGNAVLEINPVIVFPVLEMLLGGSGKDAAKISREITEIEQSILDGFIRIILHDLRTAWSPVAHLDFSIELHETEPQLLQFLAPNEAVVTISMEIRIGETAGMMNLGIPSIVVKMLRQKFDQQWNMRKTQATEEEHARIMRLISPAVMHLDARLQGLNIKVGTFLDLKEGDVLEFDYPIEKPVDVTVNRTLKFHGEIVSIGRKRAIQILQKTQAT